MRYHFYSPMASRINIKERLKRWKGEFDRNTGSIAFRAKFPNPDLLLKHGGNW
ncbi:MAG: hypothetical protein WDN26_19940 [Chitinophagaceae bacterium]